MRFGFGAIPDGTLDSSVRLAQLGEELGFDVFWIPDQTFYADPFVVMTACALHTSRIQLMLGVANPFTRHPVQVARAAITIDEISDGRMVVGYGAGNGDELVLRLGDDHSQIAQRCREAVEVTRRLLAGESVTECTDTLALDGVQLLAPPRPSIPIYVGGRSPGILRAAGALGDGVIVGSIASPNGLAYALETVRSGAEEAGRTLNGVEIVSWAGVHLIDGAAGSADFMKPIVANVIAGHRTPEWVLCAVGLPQPRIDELRGVYAREGKLAAARQVADAEAQLFAHIGDARYLRRRFAELAEIGVGQVGILLQQPGFEAKEAFLRSFAESVIRPFAVAG
jgi:5,10-methylenetetrahydromethanopterin reductase